MFPLVRDLAAEGIPVAVTCRVLKLSRGHYYRWMAQPITNVELEEAYRAHALWRAHLDDPEFGYRFLHDEAGDAGVVMAARTAWRISCSGDRLASYLPRTASWRDSSGSRRHGRDVPARRRHL